MVITHLIVDCRDAMGANAVNTMAETVAIQAEATGDIVDKIAQIMVREKKVRADGPRCFWMR